MLLRDSDDGEFNNERSNSDGDCEELRNDSTAARLDSGKYRNTINANFPAILFALFCITGGSETKLFHLIMDHSEAHSGLLGRAGCRAIANC
jgi:hypothetical protein